MQGKYNIWDTVEKRMITDGLLSFEEGVFESHYQEIFINHAGEVIIIEFDGSNLKQIEVEKDRFVPLLSTGAIDKNGKGAFLEDIVRSPNEKIWVLKFGTWAHTPQWLSCKSTTLYGWYLEGNGEQAPFYSNVEIIGNSLQNPELLEGDDED
jgi:hypothetical protein